MTSFSPISLYALTLQHSTATAGHVVGDFTGKGRQQFIAANGTRLELWGIDKKVAGMVLIYAQDAFAIIRAIASFRVAGAAKDYVVITTDSGRLVTFEFVSDPPSFKTIHFETFGKSGVRRVVPGQYLAADPKGRAIMMAAPEKNKLVYILTRSGQSDVAISSPLEAHKPQTLVFCLISLDVGYDNPMFATLEVDYSAAEVDPSGEAVGELQKELVYYELDLGLNHIVRKWSEPVDRTANLLFRVPRGDKGPGGVLCCGQDSITYRRMYNESSDVRRLAIPRRDGVTENPNRKRIIISGDLYTPANSDSFFLLQTEDGDVFKVMIETVDRVVETIRIKYFETLPIATSLCAFRSGYIIVAAESGDRELYDIGSLGDKTDDPVFDSDQFPVDPNIPFKPPFFVPRPMRNLTPGQHTPCLHPIMGMEIANPAQEEAPQIYTISGTGARSSFRTTRNALEVLDLIDSTLPQDVAAVWSSKLSYEDENDSLVILGLHSATMVMKIDEEVEEALDTGFIKDTHTIGVQQFGSDSVLQIHSKGIRLIRGIAFPNDDQNGTHGHVQDWDPPAHRTIVSCASNNRQIAIALSSGQIIYFECGDDDSLAMSEEEVHLDSTVTCLAMPETPQGRLRATFLAVGCGDQTVRIFNLVQDIDGRVLQSVSVQALSATPSDLTINFMLDNSPRTYSQYLHIGLQSGAYIRSELDEKTGDIGHTRKRQLEAEPVKFANVSIKGEPAVLVMSARPWLSYTNPRTKGLQLTPLNYTSLKSASSFASTKFNGIIAVSRDELRIFSFQNSMANTAYETIPLRHTPRKMAAYHEQGLFYVIECDNDTMNAQTRSAHLQGAHAKTNGNADTSMVAEDTNGVNSSEEWPADVFGYPRAPGSWASCIEVVDPITEKAVVHRVELKENQSLTSVALVFFAERPTEVFLAVGAAKDLKFSPYSFSAASIQIYKVTAYGRELELYHETEVPEPPTALLAFKGKLMAGIGRHLYLYDCGMRSVLRKAQANNCVPTRITDIKTQGNRLIVSDQAQSVTYVVHKDQVHPNRLIPFADDTVPRHTSASEMMDFATVVGGDKFGNIWLVRCPKEVSDTAEESPDGSDILVDRGYLGGTPNRVDLIAHYFTLDIPVSIQKASLSAAVGPIIFWAGLQGTLGALMPLGSRRLQKMFQQLELQLRTDDKPISGRDHLAFRSYFTPVKNVIDGDLIERFLVLPYEERERIAAQLTGTSWSTEDIDRAIWEQRAFNAF